MSDEFDKSLRRVERGEDLQNPRPRFDPQVHRDVVDDHIQGRKIEDYRQVLSYFGFEYTPADRLPPWDNGRPRKEGEWRSARMRLALTTQNVLSLFRGPEDFHRWASKETARMIGRRQMSPS